jgi:hypothetical protein
MLTSWERSMVCQLDGVYSPPVVEPRHTARGAFPAGGGEGKGGKGGGKARRTEYAGGFYCVGEEEGS